MIDIKTLLGKKIVGFRGYVSEYNGKSVVPITFILFDDGKTCLRLDDQDPYSYHDCNSYAKTINIFESEDAWQRMMDKTCGYKESTVDSIY